MYNVFYNLKKKKNVLKDQFIQINSDHCPSALR